MQQPASIKRFDLFYLGSMAINALTFFLGYGAQVSLIQRQYEAQGVDMHPGGILIGSFLFGLALGMLLWWLVSSKGSNIARWIVVLVFALSVLSVIYSLANGALVLTNTDALTVISTTLSGIAVYYVFRPDAKAWFTKARLTS